MALVSAVHRSLGVDRILLSIFNYVHANGDDDESLYNFATTCRAFRDPALDVLWRVQMSLAPLVKCLPVDLWEETLDVEPSSMQVEGESEDDVTLTRLILKRAPVASDWSRVGIYAARIRTLYHQSQHEKIDPEVFRALSMWGPAPLLPNLRQMQWLDADRDVFPYICLFIGQQLVDLSTLLVNDTDCPNGSRTVLASLKHNSPHLVKVDFANRYRQNEEYQPDLPYLVSDLVCRLSQLQEVFSGFPLTPEAILHLSVLPSLRVLDIPNDAKHLLTYLRNAPLQTPFVNIASLTVRGDLASCSALLRLIRPFRLASLFVQQTSSPIPLSSTTHQLFLTLNSICSHSALTSFQIYHSDAGGVLVAPESHLIVFHMLETLFVFKNLTRLDISLPVNVHNTAFHLMGLHWPLLEELNLGSRYLPCDPQVTLVSLFALSTQCHHLERLRIMVRVCADDVAFLRPRIGEPRSRNYTLTWLDLATSFCDPGVQNSDVAAILSDLFPNLETISAWTVGSKQEGGNPGQRWVDMWQDIESRLEANLDDAEEMELGMQAMSIGD